MVLIFKIDKLFKQARDLQEGLGVAGRAILEWILKKEISIRGIGSISLWMGITGEPL